MHMYGMSYLFLSFFSVHALYLCLCLCDCVVLIYNYQYLAETKHGKKN